MEVDTARDWSVPLSEDEMTQRLEEMCKADAKDGALMFRQMVHDLEFCASNFNHLHQKMWQYAQTSKLYTHLDYASHEDMQRHLDKPLSGSHEPQLVDGAPSDNCTSRATDALAQICRHWGSDFQKHIPHWPPHIGERLAVIVVRLSKYTSLSTFTARIQAIVGERLTNPRRTRGTRYSKAILLCDLKIYLERFPEGKTTALLKRKRQTSNASYEDEEQNAGTHRCANNNDAFDAQNMLEERLITPRKNSKTSVYNITASSPVSVERARGNGHTRENLNTSPLRSLQEDDPDMDYGQTVVVQLGPASPPTFLPASPSILSSNPQSVQPLVDLHDVPNPVLTRNDLYVDLRAAIESLANGGRLNDEAVNSSLQWEAKRASTDIILESSFCLSPSTDYGLRRKYTASQLGTFVIPVHHSDFQHWSCVSVDFRTLTAHHYDSMREESRCTRVFCRVKDWMLSVDKTIVVNDISCSSKVKVYLLY